MRKLGASVVMGGFFLGTIAAHAAPGQPGPSEGPRVVNPGVAMLKVDVAVVPVESRCGEPPKARVALRNRTLQPWSGFINFVAGGSKTTPVSLPASGEDVMKTVDLVGSAPLDCKKPLGVQGIRVWKDATAPLLVQSLAPKKVKALRDFPQPSSTGPTKVWVRRVFIDAICGQKVTALAVLGSIAPAFQEAKLKLAFGDASLSTAIQVNNQQSVQVPLDVPQPLDCNASGGIPALEYTLVNDRGGSKKLDVDYVTFE